MAYTLAAAALAGESPHLQICEGWGPGVSPTWLPAKGAPGIYRPSCFACSLYSTVSWNATPCGWTRTAR